MRTEWGKDSEIACLLADCMLTCCMFFSLLLAISPVAVIIWVGEAAGEISSSEDRVHSRRCTCTQKWNSGWRRAFPTEQE